MGLLNVGDWVLYQATHNRKEEERVGKVRAIEGEWVDVTWYLDKRRPIKYYPSTVMRKYSTQITKEVADVIIKSNEKE